MSGRTMRPISREQGYSTGVAIDGAHQRGFELSHADWRDIFLAITDQMATDDHRSARTDIRAEFVGPLRDGMERWRVTFSGRSFDALYDPSRALVYRVADARKEPGMPGALTGPSRDPPNRSGSEAALEFSA